MDTDVAVLAERRAKLAKLREEHFVSERDITSAPDITSVDEYRAKFQAARKQSGQLEGGRGQETDEHRIFFAQGRRKTNNHQPQPQPQSQSDLTFNPLIAEAKQRRSRGVKTETLEDGEASHSYRSEATLENIDQSLTGNGDGKFNTELEQVVEKEKSSKFYRDGEYISPSPSDDPGYQSAANSPNEFLKRAKEGKEAEERRSPKQNQLLNIEAAIDPLSVSLPETFLKTVKKDLSQSIKSTTSTKSKVHYDPRIFSAKKRKQSVDPETEYFHNMSKFYGEMHARFPEYEEPRKVSHERPNTDTDTELLETIDLTDPAHGKAVDSYSLADTVSIKTDLTDIAGDGEREGEGGNRKLRSLGESVILSVSSFGSNMRENMRENISGRVRERAGEDRVWARRTESPAECKICKHKRGTSWWTIIGLLLVDLITLIILFYGYNTLRQFHEGKAVFDSVICFDFTHCTALIRLRPNVGREERPASPGPPGQGGNPAAAQHQPDRGTPAQRSQSGPAPHHRDVRR